MSITPANVLMQLASFRNESLASLFANKEDEPSSGTSFAEIFAGKQTTLAESGRNTALFDPESAYTMMSFINNSEVSFKAQYAELASMGEEVEHLEEIGGALADADLITPNEDIKARIEAFSAEYNRWIDRFSPDTRPGGILDNVQAAEVSLFELEQNITNVFVGAKDGFRGLDDIGISIDPQTRKISFDPAVLDSALAANKPGVVAAIDQFSADFAKSADLLNQADNMIPRQLDNRQRAIDFISSHRSSLEAEFGRGDAAQPAGQVARALAAYEDARAIAA